VVLGVEAVDAPAELAGRLAEALRAQVKQSAGFKLVAGKSLEEIKLVFGCVDEKDDCMARAGKTMGVAKLLWGNLQKAGGGALTVTVKLLDVPSARLDRKANRDFSARELAGAGARRAIEKLTGSFIPGLTGSLRITCNVPGASITVGSRALGATEGAITVENLAPGKHHVSVTMEGYRPWSQEVTVTAGDTTLVEVTLEASGEKVPLPATRPAKKSDPRAGWRAAFWTAAATTVVLAVGIGVSYGVLKGAESDKDAAITDYHALTPPSKAGSNTTDLDPDSRFRGTDDVCADSVLNPPGIDRSADPWKRLDSACKKGKTASAATIGFWAATGATALVSAILYYKAYIASPGPARKDGDETSGRSRKIEWMLAPAVGPRGGGLDLQLRF
jgi:hypothetical protein